MNIGIVTPSFSPVSGGANTFIKTILDGIQQYGNLLTSKNKVYIFADKNQCNFYKNFFSDNPIIVIVQLKRITIIERLLSFLMFNSPLFRAAIKYTGPIEKVAKKNKIELIWCVGEGMQEVPDIPYIATVWDLQHRLQPFFPEVSSKNVWTRREEYNKYYLRRASYIIAGTQVGARELTQFYGISPSAIKIIPMPVQNNLQENNPKDLMGSNLSKEEKFVFYPAQFWPHKNHINLIEAMKYLKEHFNIKLHLYLVGSDKGNLNYIKKHVRSCNLDNEVRFLGFVDDEKLSQLYRDASMLVFPTFFGPDNLPPLEAFSIGCPVIASAVPGAAEQYADAAILVDPSNQLEIAMAIRSVYLSADLQNKLRALGAIKKDEKQVQNYIYSVSQLFIEFEKVRRCWGS